ncbi:MAG: VWA domain-containing protein [Pseudomonadota bacterium]
MSRVTRFAARDPGPAARVAGFLAHLRANGFRLGVSETELAVDALSRVDAYDPATSRCALKAVCTGSADDAARFDELFDSYWRRDGQVVPRVLPEPATKGQQGLHSNLRDGDQASAARGQAESPDGEDGEVSGEGTGQLIAAQSTNLMRVDLRDLVDRDDIAAAEDVARRLGAALRDRRSRRRKAGPTGDRLHFRRVIRRSLATGGEPLKLSYRTRPDRPVKITALCDISGSMGLYAKYFLAFLAGLMRADPASDAYIFHTRLVRVTEALNQKDALSALTRMSVLATGYGGGSRIGGSLEQFAGTYARRFVDRRTVLIILSDGYDTDPPDAMARALEKLRRRGCRIIWLNPLKGWAGYEPVARGMAAALPHLDLFRPANRLEDFAALAPELSRL